MKTKMLAAVLLIVISLVGCSSSSSTTVKEGIVFSMLAEEDFPELMGQSGPLDLQVRILREDDTSAYFAVNLPYNTDIGGIDLLKNGRAVINLVMRPDMERSDPFLSLSPAYYRFISVNKDFKDSLSPENVQFSLGTETLSPVIGYAYALSSAQDHMEADFYSTMDCLALMESGDGLKLAYIFFFGDGENINRAGNELIQGAVAVDSQNGQLIEYRIYNRKYLTGVYRHEEAARVEGWKDGNTLIVSQTETGDFYLLNMDRTKTGVSQEQAVGYIEQYNRTTNPPAGYRLVYEDETNDLGLLYTKKAYIEQGGSQKPNIIDLPPNVNLVSHSWDRANMLLYFTTEKAEPSYGNDWTYYTLWCYDLKDYSLKQIGGLPSKDIYLSADGTRLAYNGLEGDVFIMNLSNLIIEDPVLK
ncbi:MAG: hypothetical protein ACOX42_04875 [Clostridia bacterium]|nr:hypothetical protein [Clostridiales bacterium]